MAGPQESTMSVTLSKTETKVLTDAAGRSGVVAVSETLKPSTRERMLGRLLRDGLIHAVEDRHQLRPAGYRAIGLRPPRVRAVEGAEPRANKGALVLELLRRAEGASLAELAEATGWLPHTTRAALSRLRSAGKPLSKSKREDGVTVYGLAAEETALTRRGRKPLAEDANEAVA
jgi:hypothetical protein